MRYGDLTFLEIHELALAGAPVEGNALQPSPEPARILCSSLADRLEALIAEAAAIDVA